MYNSSESDGFVLLILPLTAPLSLMYYYEWAVDNALLWNQYLSCACFSVNTHGSPGPVEKAAVTGNQSETMFAITQV